MACRWLRLRGFGVRRNKHGKVAAVLRRFAAGEDKSIELESSTFGSIEIVEHRIEKRYWEQAVS